MNKIAAKILMTVFLLVSIFAGNVAAQDGGTRRFGLFIGANNGGRDRVMLRYAVSDARSVSKVFSEMGGISSKDNMLLIEPSARDIKRQLEALNKELTASKGNFRRTELVFYYSGHADENGLLLGRDRYDYKELRENINTIQSDMRIVILDSCSSGAFTRAKGGVKTQPFLIDSSVSAEGYAFLTSSAADEASQESDRIESSYFTHSLVTGLRGAADMVGDGRVTLNEVYHFAYTETLAKTETSVYGAQHPSYDMQINGTGDVILTDIKETSASLYIQEDVAGRISIRDSSDYLIAEITKTSVKAMELGLEPGVYRITLQRGDNFYRTEVILAQNVKSALSLNSFSLIAAETARARGDAENFEGRSVETQPGEDHSAVNLQLLPGRDVLGKSGEKTVNNFLFGLFLGEGYRLNGMGLAPIGIKNRGEVTGFQAAGIYTIADKDISGFQSAGVFNIAGGKVLGLQSSGIFNLAGSLNGLQAALVNISGEGKGVQIGLVNISKDNRIIPLGLVNVVEGGLMYASIYMDDMGFTNFGFRSGTNRFFTLFGIGFQPVALARDASDKLLLTRVGFGWEWSIGKFFIDLDLNYVSIIDVETIHAEISNHLKNDPAYYTTDKYFSDSFQTSMVQLRLSGGYKIFPHLGVFAGISYDFMFISLGSSEGYSSNVFEPS
ncbi:caspase family protein [Leadbettera azotonutricia]|uniref:Peptidase C14 caspase catalytic subunit p20 n=1 Tax=Leadbettera azotonutricia (strain ATCC BAA-888 / DSM 13862 / ZAS-9) TaxID=545695 RepID=F5YEK3_LEAAZ|nr:caspase family protein [Leadbettera azotonutricia]AEF83071.1 peptidase C14 caspase catalytic subunit p20 [Leadbettera azotonutricia ZAS-9]